MDAIQELIQISRYAGMREDLAQASGGNSSVKLDDHHMVIKGLGVQMADMTETEGYSVVDTAVYRDYYRSGTTQRPDAELTEALQRKATLSGPRPAIETFFHALTGRVTLHTHPMLVNVLTSRVNGKEIVKTLFPEAHWVGYASPGLDIGILIYKQFREISPDMSLNGLVFMENHGLTVSGPTAEAVIAQTEYVMAKIARYLNVDYAPDANVTVLYGLLCESCGMDGSIVYRSRHQSVDKNIDILKTQRHSFCPDAVVFCGPRIALIAAAEARAELEAHIRQYGRPAVIVYAGHVYIVADSVKKAKEIESVLAFCCEAGFLNREEALHLLPEEEMAFLLDWEIERFRRSMK